MRYAARQIADYDITAGEARRKAPQLTGKQRGDPDRCAAAILQAIDALALHLPKCVFKWRRYRRLAVLPLRSHARAPAESR
jgi:hypothetical protein